MNELTLEFTIQEEAFIHELVPHLLVLTKKIDSSMDSCLLRHLNSTLQ